VNYTSTHVLAPWQTLLCFTLATCIWDRYASDNKLPGTGCGSSKRPKAGKSPTCRHPAMALRGHFQKGISVAWQGNGMACVNQTRPHSVNQMGRTQSKALAERHGMCESALRVLPALHIHISPSTSSGQRNCASWTSQPQKSVTIQPQLGGKTTKSIRDMWWHRKTTTTTTFMFYVPNLLRVRKAWTMCEEEIKCIFFLKLFFFYILHILYKCEWFHLYTTV
jgi:hypothetical protein